MGTRDEWMDGSVKGREGSGRSVFSSENEA